MIYPKKVVPGLNRFYSGHFQNTPNIKTFFGYASQNFSNGIFSNVDEGCTSKGSFVRFSCY